MPLSTPFNVMNQGVDADQSDTVAAAGPDGRHPRVTACAPHPLAARKDPWWGAPGPHYPLPHPSPPWASLPPTAPTARDKRLTTRFGAYSRERAGPTEQ